MLSAEKHRWLTAQLVGIEVTDADVGAAYAAVAKQAKRSPEQFAEALADRGANGPTLRQRIRAMLRP
jgi:parvulin-like peptidyl-prolyl isomerase